MPWRNGGWYVVAAYYPDEGYGGASTFLTLDAAMDERSKMLANGYTNVHVKYVTCETIPETITTDRPARLQKPERRSHSTKGP